MEKEIKVSVILLTYNHSSYIVQALDSILSQKVDFDYEILIGDDCSIDGTQEILKKYKRRYPDKIRLFLRKKNIGATRNGYSLYINTKGNYIAQLEGDDYWSDELKLKKQVDYLDEHSEYIGCSHFCDVVNEKNELIDGKNKRDVNTYWNYCNDIFTLKECEAGEYPGHLSSLVFRNIFMNSPINYEIMYKIHNIIFDRTIVAFLAMQGNVYRLKDTMSCYRMVEKPKASNWQSLARQKNRRYEEYHYIRELEKFIQNNVNQKFSMIELRKEKLVCATVVLVNDWTWENLKVVLSIVKDSGDMVDSTKLAASAIFQKLYFRKIIGEDRPVEY